MKKEFEKMNIHQKMEFLIQEMVEKELPLKDSLREFQKIYIETTLKKHRGNKTRIAKKLGIHRNTLHNLTKSLNITK
ncbi:MAG: helix-turn-helix domain-containing protein [Candidatus Aminicenantes bacterium]